LLISYFAVCCIGLIRIAVDSARSRRYAKARVWEYAQLVSWFAISILGAFFVSLVRSPIFLPRYLIVSLPALVTIAAIGADAIRLLWGAVLVAGLLVCLSLPPLLS
jgi:hypothetical protein